MSKTIDKICREPYGTMKPDTFHPIKCSKCGKMKRSHAVCQNCGYYKGREVIDVLKDLTKKEKKKKEKEISLKEEQEPKNLSMEGLSKK